MTVWIDDDAEDENDAEAEAASGHDKRFALRAIDYVVVAGLGLIQAAGIVAFALLTRTVIDALVPSGVGVAAQQTYSTALWTCFALAVCAIILGLARTVEFSYAERAGYRVVQRVRMQMYAHLQHMRPQDLRHRARGGLLLRLTGDLSMLRMWLSRGLLEGLSAAIVLVVGFASLFWFDAWMGAAALSVLALGAALSFGSGRAMRDATRTMRRRRSLLIGNVDEQINTLRVSQVAGRTAGEYSRLSKQNDALTAALMRVANLRGRLRGIATASSLLAIVAVLAVGLIEVNRLQTDLGVVVAAAFITRMLSRPVRTLGLTHDYWHRGLVSRQKISEFLRSSSRDPREDSLPRLVVRGGTIEFRDVSVSGSLLHANATAEKGRLTAITGDADDAGVTLLNLVARLTDPETGAVIIDDQVLSGTSPTSIGAMVGYVSPDLPLLRGTVRRNLTYAAPNASEEEIHRIVKLLGIDVELGTEGLATWVTEGGANLPLGVRNLIALGRAMMGTPRILLLDEPFTGLEPNARSRAREAVLRHRGTVLLVTQDVDALALADAVWLVRADGPIQSLSGAEYREHLWQTRDEASLRW